MRRRWIAIAALLVFPAAVYWNTIFHRYGFRDDYAVLREAREEPGKVTRVCAAQARPIYGVLMEHSFAQLRTIEDLQWLRLLSAILLGAIAVVTFRLLRASKWDRIASALVAALLTLLPSAQLLVGWTVGWPLAVAVLLTLGAFAAAEKAFGARAARPRADYWAVAVCLVAMSALTYQPNSLFYCVPLAGAVWPRRRWARRAWAEWFLRHVVTLGLGVGIAFTIMTVAFAQGWVQPSHRVALEHDLLGKIAWFVHYPLHNAFALIALNDDEGSRLAQCAAALTAVIFIAGLVRECQARGWRRGGFSIAAIVALLLASFSVNLAVADRWPAYRVVFPLAGVVLVCSTIGLLTLGGRKLARGALALLLAVGAWLAHRQAFGLIAWPQSMELALLEKGAEQIRPEERPRVYAITPTPPFHRAAPRIFLDEFGSLSTDSDWTPKEMLKHIMRARYPEMPDVTERYTFACGRRLPAEGEFDVVIDLRKLRELRVSSRGL